MNERKCDNCEIKGTSYMALRDVRGKAVLVLCERCVSHATELRLVVHRSTPESPWVCGQCTLLTSTFNVYASIE
jgi:hypothetical protein